MKTINKVIAPFRAGRLALCLLLLILVTQLPVLSGCRGGAGDPGEDYVVEWADPGLENAVRQKLKKPSGGIKSSELDGMKIVHIWPDKVQFNSLDNFEPADGLSVKNFEDLAHFRNLQGVLMAGFDFENVDVLKGRDKLQRVVLCENHSLTDIGALAGLPNLVTLVIYNNKSLTDFSPLGEIATLRELDLHMCRLTDIEFLEGLEYLKVLSLHNNSISDLTPLRSSTNLQEIDIHANKISDISVMADFPRLFKLRMEGNQVSDLSPLSELKDMRVLALELNQISNLSPLENLQDLRKVTLTGNPLSAAEVAALRLKLPTSCEIVWKTA